MGYDLKGRRKTFRLPFFSRARETANLQESDPFFTGAVMAGVLLEMSPLFLVLALVLLVLNLLDVWTTLQVLRLGGRELNPIMRGLMAIAPEKPWIGLTIGKLCFAVLVCLCFARMSVADAFFALVCLVCLYAGVVLHNISVIDDLEGW